jgi:hypothetical protein
MTDNIQAKTTFEILYQDHLKPALVYLVTERLVFSKSWNQVVVTEDASSITIEWSEPKQEHGSSFHRVTFPFSFKGLQLETYNQYLKLSRKT